jgi:acetoin utilization deacetylase AcuC-like enzyme
MKAATAAEYQVTLPPGHPFPMGKYLAVRELLLGEGTLSPADLLPVHPLTDEQLAAAHDPAYIARVVSGQLAAEEVRRLGLPWSPELVRRSRFGAGGTLAAARAALAEGVAANLAGGTHHAHRDFGAGFCLFNDLAVCVRLLLGRSSPAPRSNPVRRILVLDLDVHQGDGTAAILGGNDEVMLVSVHGEHNFPASKIPSTIDIGLADGVGDREYLNTLEGLLEQLAGARFDFCIYVAGVDPLLGDRYGRLALTLAGLAERDRLVFATCKDRAIPIVSVMGGGYSKDLARTVIAHANTVRVAARVFACT